MKTLLKRRDPDFEEFTATLNGELVRHDALESADAIQGIITRRVAGGGTEEKQGEVRILVRNAGVREKEPRPRPEDYVPAPEAASISVSETPAEEAEAEVPAPEEVPPHVTPEPPKPVGIKVHKKRY